MPTSRRHGHIAVQVGSITFMLVRSPENEKKKKSHFGSHELWGAAEGARCLTIPHLFFAETIIGHLDVPI